MTRYSDFDVMQMKKAPVMVVIQRGLETLKFVSASDDLTYWDWNDQDLYVEMVYAKPAPGLNITNAQFPSDGSPSTMDISLAPTAFTDIGPGEGVRGYLEGWPIRVRLYDQANFYPGNTPDQDYGICELIADGTIASVRETTRGLLSISIAGSLAQTIKPVTEHFSLIGREDLGDDRCKMPIYPPDRVAAGWYVPPSINTGLLRVGDAYFRARFGTDMAVEDYANIYYECISAGQVNWTDYNGYGYRYPTTAMWAEDYPPPVGTIITGDYNGTSVPQPQFIVRDSWIRCARGMAINPNQIQFSQMPDPRGEDPDWFALGGLFVRSGPLGFFPKRQIAEWDPATLTATMFQPHDPTDMPEGTQFEIYPGCDQTPATCFNKFNNIENLRAETLVPDDNTIPYVSGNTY